MKTVKKTSASPMMSKLSKGFAFNRMTARMLRQHTCSLDTGITTVVWIHAKPNIL
jgi:3-hydroxyacyl-CoA dehydrogenase